jgi:hypothetical protein
MLRRFATVIVASSTLVIGVAAGSGPASALAAAGRAARAGGVVAASGTLGCTMSKGAMAMSPGLYFGGTATSVTFSFTAKLDCATGTSGVKGGTITASGTGASNDCGALAGTGIPTLTGTIRWKGKFDPTAIVVSNGNFAISGSVVSIILPSTGPTPPAGTTSMTGSFADETATMSLVADQSVSEFAAGCYNTTKGLTGFTFTGTNGASTFTVGQAAVTPPTDPSPPPPVTVGVDASDPGTAVDQDLLGFNHPVAGSSAALAAIGTTWARTDVSFEVDQGTAQAAYDCTTGAWDPTYLDGNIAIDRAAGAQPELIVDYFPSCLDFQVSGLSHKTVAADEKKWEALVYQMALHEIGVEHVTTFEVWNEPSFYMALDDVGNDPGYLTLYKLTATALEKAAATLGTPIDVGGPGVDELGEIDNSWITALAGEAVKDHLPLDFVSWHQYPNDPDEGPQSFLPDGICETGAPLGGQPCWDNPGLDVSLYARGAASVRAALARYPTLHPFLWVDEWAPDSGNDARESGPFGAAFVAAALDGAQQAGIDRMSYYDVADPSTPSVYDNFGILFGDLTPKPVYYAFAMWQQLAGSSLPVTVSPAQDPGPGVPQVGAVASVTPSGTVHVLVYNFEPYDPSGGYGSTDPTPYDDQVTLDVSGLPADSYTVGQTLVDGSHDDTVVGTSTATGPTTTAQFDLSGEGVTLFTLTPTA